MKIKLITEDFASVNKLQEVTNPVVFEKGYIPTSDGIFSKEIFGTSTSERKKQYAYIKLNGYFLSPIVYKMLKRLNKKFESIIAGTSTFIIEKGMIVEHEDGFTGIDWLYENWDKIKFNKNESNMRNERIDIFENTPKNELFISKLIVIPAFYRDINLQAALGEQQSPKLPLINDMYCKAIRYSNMLNGSAEFDFVMNNTKYKLQLLLVDIYEHLKEKISKKNGHIRKSLLGKSTDYSSRLVISAPEFSANRPEDMLVTSTRVGIPLAQCCSLFTPFMISWVKRFFQREMEQSGATYPIKMKNGEIRRVKVKDPELHFSDEYIKKQMDRFILSPGDRFNKIEIPIEDKEINYPVYMKMAGRYMDTEDSTTESPLTSRHLTWCDIFYLAAIDVTTDKHCVVTRYPLLDYFGIFINKIAVLSTHKTVGMYIGEKVYKHYPMIDINVPKANIGRLFKDTLVMSNVYLKGLGGDYDGDQVTVKGIFTQEANVEASKLMNKISNIVDLRGNNMRTTTNESVQTLYMMTKFKK